MMTRNTTEKLKNIYQAEISAMESYTLALGKIRKKPERDHLEKLKNDHTSAANTFRKQLSDSDKGIPQSSGPWGTLAKTVIGTAKLFGEKPILLALKEGEEHWLKQYQAILKEDIDASIKSIIRQKLIPQQKRHIESIDQMLNPGDF